LRHVNILDRTRVAQSILKAVASWNVEWRLGRPMLRLIDDVENDLLQLTVKRCRQYKRRGIYCKEIEGSYSIIGSKSKHNNDSLDPDIQGAAS
jgi:hypothetical protein